MDPKYERLAKVIGRTLAQHWLHKTYQKRQRPPPQNEPDAASSLSAPAVPVPLMPGDASGPD